MIAAGSGDDACRGNRAGEQIAESAAGLERAGVLEQFQLKDQVNRIQVEIAAKDFDDRRAPDMTANKLVSCGDTRAIDLRGGHDGFLADRDPFGRELIPDQTGNRVSTLRFACYYT